VIGGTSTGVVRYRWDRCAWDGGRYFLHIELPGVAMRLGFYAVVDDFGDLVEVV